MTYKVNVGEVIDRVFRFVRNGLMVTCAIAIILMTWITSLTMVLTCKVFNQMHLLDNPTGDMIRNFVRHPFGTVNKMLF